ncbi:MAG: hypothetical protein R3C26_20550 [Calditrichia bacterium]
MRDTVAFSLTVNNVNRAPIWSSVSAQSMDENSSLSVPVSASDPDGNGISLLCAEHSGVCQFDGQR